MLVKLSGTPRVAQHTTITDMMYESVYEKKDCFIEIRRERKGSITLLDSVCEPLSNECENIVIGFKRIGSRTLDPCLYPDVVFTANK